MRSFDRSAVDGRPAGPPLRPCAFASVVGVALVAGALAGVGPAGASGAHRASATLSLRVARLRMAHRRVAHRRVAQPSVARPVLSVTVSPSSGSFGSCGGADQSILSFPNGSCRTPSGAGGLQITNGGAPARVMVSGADLAPAGGGRSWVLCGSGDGVAPACTSGGEPGADQYRLHAIAADGTRSEYLSDQAQCDLAFSGGKNCHAAPGQQAAEVLALTGPARTTNTATSFTSTVTWTVVAP
jgi:hypothetical protein